jgi:hypothetical protein
MTECDVVSSVADPGSEFFKCPGPDVGSKRPWIVDPDPHQRI